MTRQCNYKGWRGGGRGHGRFRRRAAHAVMDAPVDTLARLHPGDEVEILDIGDEQARVQALRFGMAEGSRATCVTRIPAGPIVMRSGRQEIAVGRRLASCIRVRSADAIDPNGEAR